MGAGHFNRCDQKWFYLLGKMLQKKLVEQWKFPQIEFGSYFRSCLIALMMMLCMLAPLPSFIKAFGRFNRLITSHDEYHAMNKKWHISTDLWGLVFLSLKLYRFSPYACQYRWTNRSLWPFSATSYSSFGPLSPSLSLPLSV